MLSFDFEVLRRLVKFTIRRSREDRIPQVASSLTFTTVLSVVPLVTVGFAIFTAFPMFSSFQVALQGFLADHLMPAQVSIQIFKYLDEFVSKAKGLTTAGLLVLGVTAVMTMMTIESVFNVIWRVRKSRPLTQRVLVYWSIITLGPILFGLSLSISSFVLTESANWSGSLGAAAGNAHHMGPMMALGLTGTALPLTILAYTLLYVYLPNCRVEWRDAVIGAVLAGLGFELARHGFGMYMRRFPTYTAVYGAFATLPIFLIWVYLNWLITLLGATVVSLLPAIRAGEYRRASYAGGDLLDAIGLLIVLEQAREEGLGGYACSALSRVLRCDLNTMVRLLDALEARQWIARLPGDNGPERWILLANPTQISLDALFDLFVLNRVELGQELAHAPTPFNGALLCHALNSKHFRLTLDQLMVKREAPMIAVDDSSSRTVENAEAGFRVP
jgi:membrane protein|nr:YihY family inner membrane protein [Burkholderia sp. L27(2015)]